MVALVQKMIFLRSSSLQNEYFIKPGKRKTRERFNNSFQATSTSSYMRGKTLEQDHTRHCYSKGYNCISIRLPPPSLQTATPFASQSPKEVHLSNLRNKQTNKQTNACDCMSDLQLLLTKRLQSPLK